jgi:hypothetical protein
MFKNLVLTICIGKRYGKIGKATLPTIEAYAKRIDADYKCISEGETGNISHHFTKFQIYELLNKYDRIVYIDADCLVRDDTPNLFNIVPEDSFGAFNESPYTQGRTQALIEAMQSYGIQIADEIGRKYDGWYFNTGVMVLSKIHQQIFEKPEAQILITFYEQSLINARLLAGDYKRYELKHKFNRMTCLDGVLGEDRHASYIIHYAGCPAPETEFVALINKDIDIWKQTQPDYKFKRHILIDVVGGLGDQVSAEPVVRHAVDKEFKDEDIHIVTHFPRLYAHLKERDNVSVYMSGTRIGGDFPFLKLSTIASEKNTFSQFAFHGMMHQTDYSSIFMLRKQIPHIEKQIQLKVGLNDAAELVDSVGVHEFFKFIAVHPGRGWSSKTFPTDFWNKVLVELAKFNIKVAVIGKYISKEQGSIEDIVIPEGMYDWRNKLSLSSLITFLSQANVLVSNDSAPVHIAGAFDNHIVLIPSCKHPDQILPYRQGYQYHKAVAIYKRLLVDEFFESDINEDSQKTTADIPDGIKYEDYLPNPEEVANQVMLFYGVK